MHTIFFNGPICQKLWPEVRFRIFSLYWTNFFAFWFIWIFSLEELLASNSLFPSHNSRISVVSKANYPADSPNHPTDSQRPCSSKTEAFPPLCPDAIIDEILKAGFYHHSKISPSKFDSSTWVITWHPQKFSWLHTEILRTPL